MDGWISVYVSWKKAENLLQIAAISIILVGLVGSVFVGEFVLAALLVIPHFLLWMTGRQGFFRHTETTFFEIITSRETFWKVR